SHQHLQNTGVELIDLAPVERHVLTAVGDFEADAVKRFGVGRAERAAQLQPARLFQYARFDLGSLRTHTLLVVISADAGGALGRERAGASNSLRINCFCWRRRALELLQKLDRKPPGGLS